MIPLINEHDIGQIQTKMPLLAKFLSKGTKISVPEGKDFVSFFNKIKDSASKPSTRKIAAGFVVVGIFSATPLMVLDPQNKDHLVTKFITLDFPKSSSPHLSLKTDNVPLAGANSSKVGKSLRTHLKSIATSAASKDEAPKIARPLQHQPVKSDDVRQIPLDDISPRLRKAISYAHQTTGVSSHLLATFSYLESRMNQHIGNTRSSAEGAFQFTKSSWLDTIDHFGMNHSRGLAIAASHIERDDQGKLKVDSKDAEKFISKLRDNLPVATMMAAEAIKHNQGVLERKYGPGSDTLTNLYVLHLLGPTSGLKFLNAEFSGGTANCSDVFKSGIKANREIFTRDGKVLTVREAYNNIETSVMTASNKLQVAFPEHAHNSHLEHEPAPTSDFEPSPAP